MDAGAEPGDAASTLELLDVCTRQVLRHFDRASPTCGAPVLAQGLLVRATYDGHVAAWRPAPPDAGP